MRVGNKKGLTRGTLLVGLWLVVLTVALFNIAAGALLSNKQRHEAFYLESDWQCLSYGKLAANGTISQAALVTTSVASNPGSGIPSLRGGEVYVVLQLKKADQVPNLNGVKYCFRTEPDSDSAWYLFVMPDFRSATSSLLSVGYKELSELAREAKAEKDGSVRFEPGATGHVVILYNLESGEPSAMSVESTGVIPGVDGIKLPKLKPGDTYLLIQSAEATGLPVYGHRPVLDMSYGVEHNGGYNRYYVLPRALAHKAQEHLVDFLPSLEGKVRPEARPLVGWAFSI